MNRDDFEQLLSTDVPNMSGKKIWLWGTGNTAELYQEGLKRLQDEGFNFEGYCDNNSSKWGNDFYGKTIVSPASLQNNENVLVLICSIQSTVISQIKQQCEQLHLESYVIDEVVLKHNKEKVLKCYDMLYDEKSKSIYANVIFNRIKGIDNYSVEEHCQYFDKKILSGLDIDVFVDCGAYVGDTIEEYVGIMEGKYKRIVAFEPDERNYMKMQDGLEKLIDKWMLDRNSIITYPLGVGDKMQYGTFQRYADNNGLGSKFVECEENGKESKVVALDNFLKEPYTYLKADIEGYEYKMLLGAQKGIKEYKPVLAICIYHNAIDLYSIPLLIHSFVPSYRMSVRHYSDTAADTVLYAWDVHE